MILEHQLIVWSWEAGAELWTSCSIVRQYCAFSYFMTINEISFYDVFLKSRQCLTRSRYFLASTRGVAANSVSKNVWHENYPILPYYRKEVHPTAILFRHIQRHFLRDQNNALAKINDPAHCTYFKCFWNNRFQQPA